jgi:hypothetical protein
MAVKIQIRRGAGTVPNLDEGELAFKTDTKQVFVGDSTAANVEILTEISRQVLEGQIAGKANTSHDHSIEEVTGLLDALVDLENDKSNVGHTHLKADITDFDEHTHLPEDVIGLQDALDLKFNIADFETHTHTKNQITDFEHTHLKADITDFEHTHAISEITNLQTSLDTVGQVAGFNTRLGLEALNVVDTTLNRYNTAVGYQALQANTTGTDNTANGVQALFSNTTGGTNTANGLQALFSNTTGFSNTANGLQALGYNTTGNNNTANGLQALQANTTGSDNTANGASAGLFIADGSTANETGNNSVFIGADTKALANGQTNQIVIGHNATGKGSNTVQLGNSSVTAGYIGDEKILTQTDLDAKLNTSLKGQANGLAELDGFGKLKVSQIPDYIKGSMSLVGVVDLSSTTSSTPQFLSLVFSNFPSFEDFSEFESVLGSYAIVTEGGFLRNTDPQPGGSVGYAFILGDDGVDADPLTGFLKVEKGDWIIFVDGTEVNSSIKYYNFTVLNNTYTEASSTDFGVVKLSGSLNPNEGVYPVIRDSQTTSGTSGVTGGLIVQLPKLIDAKNIFSETQFATLTREAGVVYGAYNETTRVITWYFGV